MSSLTAVMPGPRGGKPGFRFAWRIALWAIGLSASPVLAADHAWWLHLNGGSYHFNRRDLNEENWGAGATWEFRPERRWVWAAEADVFKDSFGDPSGLAGASLRRRFRWLDCGVIAFVMYRRTAEERIGSAVFPGALPFLEAGTQRIRVRTAYIPAVTGRDDEALTLQVLVRL